MSTLSSHVIPIGTTIKGKWNKREYTIERVLGEGANGAVYLVRKGSFRYAMKIGFHSPDLQSEANVLRRLNALRRSEGPFLLDVDDADGIGESRQAYAFYVMKYMKGTVLSSYLSAQGIEWLYPIGSRLLAKLSRLHSEGWVFGDLKADNVMVSGYADVELVDYGGVTPMGRAVRQFTEIYDRGFWGAGLRSAEPAYDLFSFAVLMLHLADPRQKIEEAARQLPQSRTPEELIEIIRTTPEIRPVAAFLARAIRGEYRTADEAAAEWKRCILQSRLLPATRSRTNMSWAKTLFFVSLTLFVAAAYYVFQ